VSDCASITTVHAETWFRAVTPKTPGQQPGRTVQGAKGAELRRTEHVAIDRWTGGASDGRLFSEYEPHGFTFEPLRFRLHLGRLPGHQRAVAIMLLLITVRELAEGRLPLGGRTTRGYGCVSVTGIRVTGGGLDITAGTTLDLHADEFAHLRTAWHKHLKEA
jgi:CRISPR/Cas system CSM-associated protein Csm3 (group 7 of RAMP superfamily)